MSLTGILKSPGPVRDWFTERFPNTSAVAGEANLILRGGDGTIPCAVAPPPGSDIGLVGTAVGYVLSAQLRPEALDQSFARVGAARMDRFLSDLDSRPSSVEATATARIRTLCAYGRPTGSNWTELLGLCVLLARFEQVYRVGPSLIDQLARSLAGAGGNLDALVTTLVSEAAIADLDALAAATLEDHAASLAASDELHIDPSFAQSPALGGADADLIADRVLIELKSSAQVSPVRRADLWQLVGYLMADTKDLYGIERLAVYALRRRRQVSWSTTELLTALADAAIDQRSIERYRLEFAQLLD